jgi:hypothetical protein
MRWFASLLLFVTAATLPSGLWAQAALNAQSAPVGRVAVAATGAVSFDRKPITLEALRKKLADLKRRNGEVWYYREDPAREPTSQATAVLKLIVESKLPVSMSTTPDYSNVVMPDGTTRPRDSRPRPR